MLYLIFLGGSSKSYYAFHTCMYWNLTPCFSIIIIFHFWFNLGKGENKNLRISWKKYQEILVFTTHIQGNIEMGQLYIVQHSGKNSEGQHIYLCFKGQYAHFFFLFLNTWEKTKCDFVLKFFYFLNSFYQHLIPMSPLPFRFQTFYSLNEL